MCCSRVCARVPRCSCFLQLAAIEALEERVRQLDTAGGGGGGGGKRVFARTVRKKLSRLTGVRGFLSGKKAENEETDL